MAEGYANATPNVTWWRAQVEAGIKFRNKLAHQDRWNDWRAYYRGQWKPGILPVNLFHMMARSIVPRVYFRNPSVSIRPTRSGPESMALALVLQRLDNMLLERLGVKSAMKRTTFNTWMFGTGALNIGFGSVNNPSPDSDGAQESKSTQKMTTRYDYREGVRNEQPWILPVHTGNLVLPASCDVPENARWKAMIVQRPVWDVQHDPRLTLKSKSAIKGVKKRTIAGTAQKGGSLEEISDTLEVVDLVIVRDRQTRKVFVYLKEAGNADLLFYDDDPMYFDDLDSMRTIVFNEDDEYCWGVPDSMLLEPYQLEINEIRTQKMKHRRMAIVKLLYEMGAIKDEDVEKLLSEDVVAGVQVEDIDKIKPLQVANVPIDLYNEENGIMANVRETMGMSRNEFGEYNSRSGDTTATEAMIVRMATELRVDERRDILADVLLDSVKGLHHIIFNHWDLTDVVEIMGPGSRPIFVEFQGKALEAEYNIDIDPDQAVPMTKQLRAQNAKELYQTFAQDPYFDPFSLRRFLLNELGSPQLEHMLRSMDMGQAGLTPDNPIGIQDLGRVLGNARDAALARPGGGQQPGSEGSPDANV